MTLLMGFICLCSSLVCFVPKRCFKLIKIKWYSILQQEMADKPNLMLQRAR